MRQLGNFGRRVLKALVRHPSGSERHRRSRRNSLLRAAERVDKDVGMHPAVDEVAETMFGIRNALAESGDLDKLFAVDRNERYLRYEAMLERKPKDGDTDKIAARNFEKAMNTWAVTACSLTKLAAYKMLVDIEPDDAFERKRIVRVTERLLELVQSEDDEVEKDERLLELASGWHDPDRVVELPVGHRPRRRGRSKYGVLNRVARASADLMAIRWMRRRKLDYEVTRSEP